MKNPPGPPVASTRATASAPGPSRSAESASASGTARSAGAEPLAEFAGRRIEFSAADGVETVVQHAAIETRHVAVDGKRLGRDLRWKTRAGAAGAPPNRVPPRCPRTPPLASARSVWRIAVRPGLHSPPVRRLVRVAAQEPHPARLAGGGSRARRARGERHREINRLHARLCDGLLRHVECADVVSKPISSAVTLYAPGGTFKR